MNIIDTETITTDAGDYTVKFINEEGADQPYDEGFILAIKGRPRQIDISHGEIPNEVDSFLKMSSRIGYGDYWDSDYRSGAALVRYLKLKGYRGVTLVDSDYHPAEASTDRFERVYGVAWAPEDVPAQMADSYVVSHLKEWLAWAEGDVLGYIVEDPNDCEIASCWGYYGYDREKDYILSEATAEAKADAADRIVSANLVGSGFVGLI